MLIKTKDETGHTAWIDAGAVRALTHGTGKDGSVIIGVTGVIIVGLPPIVVAESMDDVAARINAALAPQPPVPVPFRRALPGPYSDERTGDGA